MADLLERLKGVAERHTLQHELARGGMATQVRTPDARYPP